MPLNIYNLIPTNFQIFEFELCVYPRRSEGVVPQIADQGYDGCRPLVSVSQGVSEVFTELRGGKSLVFCCQLVSGKS